MMKSERVITEVSKRNGYFVVINFKFGFGAAFEAAFFVAYICLWI